MKYVSSDTDMFDDYRHGETNYNSNGEFNYVEYPQDPHEGFQSANYPEDFKDRLYPVPIKPYNELSNEEKILYKLNDITINKGRYWLAHSELTDKDIEIHIQDFLKLKWVNNPLIFYEPRFTLTVYLNEIKRQYLEKNPENDKTKALEIVVPFAWSDWVDLTMLDEELYKDPNKRKGCKYLRLTHHATTKYLDYCINSNEITDEELESMSLPSKDFIPGFAIKQSPGNKASNEVRMLEGKSHLLTYAKNPLKLVFLSENGVYEAQVENKKRLVDSNLFENYLINKNIQNYDAKLTLNPVKEFEEIMKSVHPATPDPSDDIYGMIKTMMNASETDSRQISLSETMFSYKQEEVEKQIDMFESRLKKLETLTTNELLFEESNINMYKLLRSEVNYFEGLKYANASNTTKEDSYFYLALLNTRKGDKIPDNGELYDWRFFNGAMRYLKPGWSRNELIIREKALKNRLLRNWYKFANEKGIISWISHATLLSWYWNGLLFPFNEGIDIEMPVTELTRLALQYNQTLIVEDVTEGYGKYFIDCSPFLHYRNSKNELINNVDVRFIDVDSGSYISITGVGMSEEEPPQQYQEMVQQALEEVRPRPVYNSRTGHFVSHEELGPLKLSQLEGVPVYIPNKIGKILADEYGDAMKAYTHKGYYFVDAINLWVPGINLTFLFEHDPMIKQDYKSSRGSLIENKFIELVKNNMTSDKVLQLLNNNENLLIEYYLTKEVTRLHKQELRYLFSIPDLRENYLIGNVGTQLEEVTPNYHKFTSKFRFGKPMRRPLYNYEHIDRPKHHKQP